MASTRLKNTPGEYCYEQRSYRRNEKYTTNPEKRFNPMSAIPCSGVNIGGMPNTVLSSNAVDIESELYGIGLSNLVKPYREVTPRINVLPMASFFPREQTLMPEPLVVEDAQRPVRP
jgi:hypothetical protein